MQLVHWIGPVVPEVPEQKSSHAALNISGPNTTEKRSRKKGKQKFKTTNNDLVRTNETTI